MPFRICLTSGDKHAVRNRDLAVTMKSRLFLAAPESDRWVLIPYLHIAAVESLGNSGRRRSARRKRDS